MLIAAESTARLPQTCHHLSARHQRLATTQRAIGLSLIYPLGMLHCTAFLLPFIQQLDFESGIDSIELGSSSLRDSACWLHCGP